MLTLTIIRHAKTNQESSTGKDFDRELLPRGISQCDELATYLKTAPISPELILVSTAKRTQKTFELIRHSFSNIEKNESSEFYLASQQELLQYFWKLGHSKNVLLIGHNYGISDFASYITNEFIDLGTSELIHIEIPIDDWSELSNDQGKITYRFRPEA